jgi:hypothetical protein
MFMKPYDGGGWAGVSRSTTTRPLRAAYEKSGRHVMHLQQAVHPHDRFVRSIGLGPQVRHVLYDPAPRSTTVHDEADFLSADDEAVLRDMTLTINTFFGWDFNSCESARTRTASGTRSTSPTRARTPRSPRSTTLPVARDGERALVGPSARPRAADAR